MNSEQLSHRFDYHPPRDLETVTKHETVCASLELTAHELNQFLPEGREKSLVMTHLEDAMMWANAAIARNPDGEIVT